MFPTPKGEELAELERLGRRICEEAAHLEAAKARWLKLVAEFDRGQGGLAEGCRSTAHWLNWRCGVSMGEARNQVRVARALEERPLVAEAFGAGEISFAKARAMSRAPSAVCDGELVDLARSSTCAHLEMVVRAWRRADVSDEEAKARREARHGLTYGWDDEGDLSGRFHFPPDAGALLVKALQVGRDELRERRKADAAAAGEAEVSAKEGGDGWARGNADALLLTVEAYLAHGVAERGGDERYQLLVHVRLGEDEGWLEEGGVALSMEALRRIGCDARIVTLIEDAKGCPLDVARETRRLSRRLRRALRAQIGRAHV